MSDHLYTVVDAFTDKPFAGNPAAVMLLDEFHADELLQKIAMEHNLAETAFVVRRDEALYDLRWFTPTSEVPLCGHATLAAGHALFEEHGLKGGVVRFETKSGTLAVERAGDRLKLDLPAHMPQPMAEPVSLKDAIGLEAEEVLTGQFMLAVLRDEDAVRAVVPNQAAIELLPTAELGITAPGRDVDMVSRLFAPQLGIPEDPFTGALHAMTVPYWANRLGKTEMTAFQASARGGEAVCELSGERVFLLGKAVVTMRGQMVF